MKTRKAQKMCNPFRKCWITSLVLSQIVLYVCKCVYACVYKRKYAVVDRRLYSYSIFFVLFNSVVAFTRSFRIVRRSRMVRYFSLLFVFRFTVSRSLTPLHPFLFSFYLLFLLLLTILLCKFGFVVFVLCSMYMSVFALSRRKIQ